MTAIERAKAKAAQNRVASGIRNEMDRILGVALREPPTELEAERLGIKWSLALRKYPGAPLLWPIQGWALEEASLYGSIVCPIGVGGGKTWIVALLPTVLDAKLTVVLTRPSLVEPTRKAIHDLASWYAVYPHSIKVISYSTISTKGADLLQRLQPDLIIADEAHDLRHLTSNRSRRALSYILDTGCVFVPLSGTMTERSIHDYVHLYALALRDRSPLPNDSTIDVWSSVLDSKTNPSANDKLALRRLLPAHRSSTVETLRAAYKRRLLHTPGVITGSPELLGTGLEIHRWLDCDAAGADLKASWKRLRDAWELPGGEELVDALEYARHTRTLALGFYNRLQPAPVTDPELVEEWREARRRWGGAMRWALDNWAATRPGFDSKGLLCQAGREWRLQGSTQRAWDTWASIREEIEWVKSVEWVSTRPITAAIERFTETARGGKGIIWYSSSTALEPLFREMQIPVYGRGSKQPTGCKGIIACQAKVHATGWNAQYDFADCLVLEPWASATKWDQGLGRTHRPGQIEDTVRAFVPAWTPELRKTIRSAIVNAHYIEETEGRRTKLLCATLV